MKSRSEPRYRFNLFLTVWMAVVGMGVSVSHAHLLGGQPHTHGLGWFAASGQWLPTGPTGSTTAPHRHLLLLGIELTGECTPDATGTGPAVDVTGVGTPDTDELGLPVATAAFALQATFLHPVASPATNALPSSPAPAIDLCHFARRALTGVLRS